MRTLLLSIAVLLASAAAVARAEINMDYDEQGIVDKVLRGGVECDEAVAEMRRQMSRKDGDQSGYACMSFRYKWADALLRKERYRDVADLALFACTRMGMEPYHMEGILAHRIKALWALEQYEDALSASKQLYLIATMQRTGDAMLILAKSLKLARPNDPDAAERFKREQLAGAVASDAPPAKPEGGSVLDSIKLTPADLEFFGKQLMRFQHVPLHDYPNSARLGNYLLLCDRPDEARRHFEVLYERTYAEVHLKDAFENVARAIKAEDGAIGRANAWILANREK